jgi:hypothetical protein
VVYIEINRARPDAGAEGRPGDHFAGMVDQELKDAKGLDLQRYALPVTTQFTCLAIDLEFAKSDWAAIGG